MLDLLKFATVVNALVLPAIGLSLLLMSKLAVGVAARRAERRFLAALLVMTIVTLRTVITCDDLWLVHTATLSMLIVGALLVPNQDASVAV